MTSQMHPGLTQAEVPSILHLLEGSLKQDGEIQKQSEAALAMLGDRTGFCSCLLEIVADPQCDHSAKWLAATQLKNHVIKHWKARPDQRGVSDEEKAHLRQRMLTVVAQEDNQIAVQVALVFAKIARHDYPRQWPSLFLDLLDKLSAADTLTIRRIYFTLHHILKELSTKRLPEDQRNFGGIASTLFDHIWQQWCSDSQAIITSLPAGLAQPMQAQALLVLMERWLNLQKVLRRLMLFGFPSDAKTLQPVAAVGLCVPALLQAAQALLAARPSRPQRSQLLAMVDRGVLKLTKALCAIQDTHPWSYHAAGMLIPTAEFCFTQISTVAGGSEARSLDRLMIQCMLFLHAMVKNDNRYRQPKGSQSSEAQSMSAGARASLSAFWSPDRLARLVGVIVEKIWPLSARELEEWSQGPEEFYHAHDGGAWQEQLRPCAVTLYLALFEAHRAVVAPLVLGMLQHVSTSRPAGSVPGQAGPNLKGVPTAVLLKEAVYNAVATGAYELHDYMQYNEWLHNTLLQELADQSPPSRILRRAAARILGCWVPKLQPCDRPACYRSLIQCMADSDACLQLTAVHSLRSLIDDWHFDDAQFSEFIPPAMHYLAQILRQSSELDTQTQVFSLMNLIVERVGDHFRPYIQGILPLLPEVWVEAEGQSLLRIQVLTAFQRLVNVLGPDSVMSYPLMVPMLRHALDVSVSKEPELLEDGLQLWLVALRNAPDAQAQLLDLFPYLTAAMAASTEHILLGMLLLSSCILLGGSAFLQQYGQQAVAILSNYVGNVSKRGMLLLYPPIDLMLLAFPTDAPQLLQPVLLKLMTLLLFGQEETAVIANGVGVFARLLLCNATAFQHLLHQAASTPTPLAASQARPELAALPAAEQLLTLFLEMWMEHADFIATPGGRKLSALAMCQCLALPSRVVLHQLDLLLANITSVWLESESAGGGVEPGTMFSIKDIYQTVKGDDEYVEDCSSAYLVSEDAEADSRRRRLVSEADPLNKLRIGKQLQTQLAACSTVHGQAFHDAISHVDQGVMAQVKLAIAAH